jgi:hypothetical protein
MGYSITIGELEVEKNPDDGLDCPCLFLDAKGESHEGAPAFGEPTDQSNSRWPSYSTWSDCLRDAGLHDVFFCDGHLVGGHPGVRLVTNELRDIVRAKKAEFEAKYPNVEATYGDKPEGPFGVDESNPKENSTYCRIVWLDYWIDWALKNCKTPVIANS